MELNKCITFELRVIHLLSIKRSYDLSFNLFKGFSFMIYVFLFWWPQNECLSYAMALFQLTHSPFLVALLLFKMNQNNIRQGERINNAKTRFNWIEFTDNDDCKANRKMRELEREENTATALRKKKSFYKGPHLNDTFVIFCHVTHASTKKHPVPFFWKNFSKAFSFFFSFWIFSSFSLNEIMPNFAYDRLINFVWSQYLFSIVEMRTTQLLFKHAQVHFNSNGGKMWTRDRQRKSVGELWGVQ